MARIAGQALNALGWEIRRATLSLKLDVLIAGLERRYRPDQPRAPRGTPEGGRWIDQEGATGEAGARLDRTKIALTEFGLLAAEWRLGDGTRMCVYDLGSQKWIMVQDAMSQIGCHRLLHQSSIFRGGQRLNDNR